MGDRGLTRRLLLRGAAVGTAATATIATAGCSEERRPPAAAPATPDPDAALLGRLIDGKEQLIALYRQAAQGTPKLAAALRPFEQRHQAHLAELRRRLPAPQAGPASADALASSPPAASPTESATGPSGESAVEPATASAGSPGHSGPSGSPSPGGAGSPEASPSASPAVVTVTRLRAAERAAAASRAGQLASASPALAQLVACIGACEAAHVIALPSSRAT
ncbi:hypothetical protein AB0K60_33135 [Thermopolyspora sp. NPDC052614]|uniref:hypothetical protein n=1 Tax=Thermopolyspora sp. NPDC052614 TaxID=3155682 RepID=UPI00341447C8